MIPTQENKKKLTEKKLQVHKKISNTFIENAINNSNTSALKIIYYLASILKDFNYKEEFNTLNIDLKDMLKYTELRASDIRNNIKKMQQTSITFINEEENIEHGISLLPKYKFYWNKNKVDIVLNKTIAKLIVEVTDKYTFINTKDLMRLKNKHSIRLLPLLNTINGYTKKQKTLSMAEINAFFGTKYKRLVELEREIIKKVKTELDNNNKISFDYEINYDNVGQGKPKATSVTIKPLNRDNYQSTIFTNIEEIQEQKEEWLIDIKTLEFLENNYKMNPNKIMEKVREFKSYCKENNKKYKNMDTSFKRYIKIGIENGWSI